MTCRWIPKFGETCSLSLQATLSSDVSQLHGVTFYTTKTLTLIECSEQIKRAI